jgi:Na+-transporting NADH:ubiquinone oxidoreductase subunit NqrC
MRWTFGPVALLVAGAGSAHAVQYLTVEQAQKLLFPAAAEFKAADLLLTDAQRQAVAQASGVRVRDAHVRAWSVRNGQGGALGRFFVDEVTGKHDLITYALAVAADGQVIGIEILDYRENYGGQVREAAWRAQFRGKTVRDPLKVDGDIANISGATLSCNHVTDGVRRLLAVNAAVPG